MNETTTLLEQAKTLYKEGKLAESEAAFGRLIASGSDVGEGFYGVGLVRGSMHDRDAAIASFEKALEHDPRHANAFYQLAFLTEQRGDLQEATKYYRKALSVNPQHRGAQTRLGRLSNLQPRTSFSIDNGSSSREHTQAFTAFEGGATPHLVVEGSETLIAGTQVPLVKEITTLGRSSDSDLALVNDDSVSSLHVRITKRDGDVYLEDVDSTNGTYVNGRKVSEPLALLSDAEIRVGSTSVRYVAGDAGTETRFQPPRVNSKTRAYSTDPRAHVTGTTDDSPIAYAIRDGAPLNPENRRPRRYDGDIAAQPPAAGDAGSRLTPGRSSRRSSAPWRPTLAGDAVVGVVRGFRPRSEPDYPYNFFPWQIWTFSVEREDEAGNRLPSILVEMRGHEFTGFIEEGDTVEVPGTPRAGAVIRNPVV